MFHKNLFIFYNKTDTKLILSWFYYCIVSVFWCISDIFHLHGFKWPLLWMCDEESFHPPSPLISR